MMTKLIRLLVTASAALLFHVRVFAFQVTPGQGGFVQTDAPSVEQVPAAPLLIAAYAIAWVLVFFFVWTIWRRLAKVETDMRALERRQSQRNH
jgi:hypothetical protein